MVLGDSYSSGLGVQPNQQVLQGPSSCYRLPDGWGSKFATPAGVVACAGAETADIFSANQAVGVPSQLDRLKSDANAKIVTITIGGNDAGFLSVLPACVTGFGSKGSSDCKNHPADPKLWSKVDAWLTALSGPTAGEATSTLTADGRPVYSLKDVYQAIYEADRSVDRILVVGYPLPFDETKVGACTVGGPYQVSDSDKRWINKLVIRLNQASQDAVNALQRSGVPITYVSLAPSFDGHGLCGAEAPYLNGVSIVALAPSPAGFHPDPAGQAAILAAVKAAAGV